MTDYPRALPSASGEIKVDYGVMKDVCEKLKTDLKDLEGGDKGTPLDFRTNGKGLVTGEELGRYPAAEGVSGNDGLAGTCKNAYNLIQETYDAFLEAYDDMVEKLNKTTQNHGDAEQKNKQNSDQAYN